MTEYHCWFDGYRNNENPVSIQADSHDEAAENFCTADFWLHDEANRKSYFQPGGKGKTVFVQAQGDDQPKMFCVTGEASVEFWVDEI